MDAFELTGACRGGLHLLVQFRGLLVQGAALVVLAREDTAVEYLPRKQHQGFIRNWGTAAQQESVRRQECGIVEHIRLEAAVAECLEPVERRAHVDVCRLVKMGRRRRGEGRGGGGGEGSDDVR